MKRVLDDTLRSGAAAAELHLRPPRTARLLPEDDYSGAVETISRMCQTWGGVADLLVPVNQEGPSQFYRNLVCMSDIDRVTGPGMHETFPHLSTQPIGFVSALAVAAAKDRTKYRTLEVCTVDEDAPWHLGYIGGLGHLPVAPDAETLASQGFRPDLTFEEFLPVRHVTDSEPSADGLVQRLAVADAFTPTGFSLLGLTTHPTKVVHSVLDGWRSERGVFARQTGPYVIVIYRPRKVADLALLWNLRAVHGWMRTLPLGVPLPDNGEATIAQAVKDIQTLITNRGPGIQGWPIALVSATVGKEALEAIRDLLGSVAQVANVVELGDVLVPATVPSRSSRAAVTFENGIGRVGTRTDDDRTLLAPMSRLRPRPHLYLTVTLNDAKIPPSPTLNRKELHGGRYTGGGCTLNASNDEIQKVHWPANWTILEALVRDRGLTASPSASGRSALALLESVGDLDSVWRLAHRPLLALLYKKSATSGMSWWKKRAADQAKAVAATQSDPDAAFAELKRMIEDVSVSRGGESAATLTFGELCTAIGDKRAARLWLRWAEERSLLLRGTTIKCQWCQREAWRPVAELGPPIICDGCTRTLSNPFEPTSLPFSYRLGESLRRAIEMDSIYHLLVMRTIQSVLEGGVEKIVGVHPGVDFRNGIGEQLEADILVVMGDGDLFACEVKSRSTGLKDADIEHNERLARWLGNPTVLFACGETEEEAAPSYIAAAEGGSGVVRRLLTADDWLARKPHLRKPVEEHEAEFPRLILSDDPENRADPILDQMRN
ncbi:hypothetical protein ACWEF6_06930 [Amycolatopsis sp. NPDC004772]